MAKIKTRERTMLNTICLGIVAALATGIVSLVVLINIPNTIINHFWGMYTVGPMLPQSSPLFQMWQDEMDTQEVLVWTPLALLVGGFTIGALAPSRVTFKGRVLAAAKTFFGLLFTGTMFVWLAECLKLDFKIPGYMIPVRFFLVQIGCFIGWSAVAALGAALGAWVLPFLKQDKASAGSKRPPKTASTRQS